MLLRNKKERDIHEGKWNGLGGKFDPGETPEECVIREVKEESGFIVQLPRMCGVMTFPGFTPGKDWVVFLFKAENFKGQQIESPEGRLEWIANEKLLDLNLWEGDRYFLKWLEEGKFFSARFVYKNKKLMSHSVIFYC